MVPTLPLGIFIHQVAFLVQCIGTIRGAPVRFGGLQRLDFFDIIYGRPMVLAAVRKGTMQAILSAKAATVRIMYAHAGLVVSQMVTTLGIPRSAM